MVLVSSAWKENTNIITMGWHMVLEFSPSLVACCISNANHSFEMIRRSQECVINVPTTDLVNKVIGIGNCSGAEMDKFKAFGLTPAPATNWDDILRLIATIKLKELTASELFRRLNSYSKQHALYHALKAFGQIPKSLFKGTGQIRVILYAKEPSFHTWSLRHG